MKKNYKSERLCEALEEVACKMYPIVRKEEGFFQTGTCELKGEEVLFLNNRQPIDERIASLASAIARCEIEDFYLKPLVREEIEKYSGNQLKSAEI